MWDLQTSLIRIDIETCGDTKKLKTVVLAGVVCFYITKLLHERTDLWPDVNEIVLLIKYGEKENQICWTDISKQTGQSAKWLGIQTFTLTSRMALGPISGLFSQGQNSRNLKPAI